VNTLDIIRVLELSIESAENAKKIEPEDSVKSTAMKWEIYSCLQNLLDSVAMIVVDLRMVKPGTYGELGFLLYEKGVISREAAELIRKTAATRNLIAHAYRRVEEKELIEIADNLLPKVEELCKTLIDYVRKSNLDPEIACPPRCLDVFKRNKVKLVYLFGSRARGTSRKDSDYDFAVLLGKNVTVEDEVKLTLELADALGVSTDMVDVTALDKADLGLIYRIFKEGKLIYACSDDTRRSWERNALSRILEGKEIYDLFMRKGIETFKGETVKREIKR